MFIFKIAKAETDSPWRSQSQNINHLQPWWDTVGKLHITDSFIILALNFLQETSKHLPSDLEEDTELWPIADHLVEDYKSIKWTYYPMPLPVYSNDCFVEPTEANQTLKNTLTEIHFSVLHYRIGYAGENAYDSTSAAAPLSLKNSKILDPCPTDRKSVV